MESFSDIIPPFDLPIATILLYVADWMAIVVLAAITTFFAVKARAGRVPKRESNDRSAVA